MAHTSNGNPIFKHTPYLFTENGVAMEGSNGDRLDKLQNGTNQLFKVIFERLDSIDEKISKKVAGNLEKKDQR